ncbi:MAG: DUF5676 family membrane protein [archaeon]|nr:DUF5676 family membrane protein [archaeon]
MKDHDLSYRKIAIALSTTAGILYILCAALFVIAPNFFLNIVKDIFHGIDITQIAQSSVSFSSTVIGFIEIIIYSLIASWLFVWAYNEFR